MKTENIQAILPGTKFQKSTVANPAAFEQLLVQVLNGESIDYKHLGEAEIHVQDNDVQMDIQSMKSDEELVCETRKPSKEMDLQSEDGLKPAHSLCNPFYMGLENAFPYGDSSIMTSKADSVAIENINELNIIQPQDSIISNPESLELTNNVNEGSDKQTKNTPMNYLPHHQIQKDENGQEDNSIAREIKMDVAPEQGNSVLSDVKGNPIKNTIAEALEGASPGKNQELPQTIFAPEKIPNEKKEQSTECINPVYYNAADRIKKDIHQVESAIPENLQKASDEKAQEFLPMRSASQSTVIEVKGEGEKTYELVDYAIQEDDSQKEQQVLLPYQASRSKQVAITLDTHNVNGSAEVNNESAVKIDGNEMNTKFQDKPVRDSLLETDEVKLNSVVNPFIKEVESTSNEFRVKSLEDHYSNRNLQKINDSIIELIETTSDGDTSIMKVKLYPEEFGTVNVILHLEEGKVIVKILVDNESVKQLFQSKLNELNHNLNKQNVRLDEVHIDLNDQGEGSAHRDSNPHQHKNNSVKRKYNLKTAPPELSYGETKPSASRQISILA